jgi:hypothetical protein
VIQREAVAPVLVAFAHLDVTLIRPCFVTAGMVSNTRLYGAAIAFASGLYSVSNASAASSMGTSGWLMLVLGTIVLLHGIVLLTPYASRLGAASGPLMIAYSLVMLLNQALLGTGMIDDGSGMGMSDGMGMGSSAMTAGMGWDAGMATLAILMLVSGLIMTRGDSMADASDGM